MSQIVPLLEAYLAGPIQLRQAVAGVTRAQSLARPVPGKWSTLEVVCHLADFDPINADRMKRVIAEDRPSLLGADENRFVAALNYHGRDLEEELAIIDITRSQMAKILRVLPDEALQRAGMHNERGPCTLAQLLTVTTNHVVHHLKFIEEKMRALRA